MSASIYVSGDNDGNGHGDDDGGGYGHGGLRLWSRSGSGPRVGIGATKGGAVTLDTSHLEMSALNIFASANKRLMSVTPDTSHSPIAPCVPADQSPFCDSSRHAFTALWSTSLDLGSNFEAVEQPASDIVPHPNPYT